MKKSSQETNFPSICGDEMYLEGGTELQNTLIAVYFKFEFDALGLTSKIVTMLSYQI